MDIFDILGPTMVGPSSSHTAGAVRIGGMGRSLLGERPVSADIRLHGSFAQTGCGHGTDRALVAGLLGMRPDDLRIPDSFAEAEKCGLDFKFSTVNLGNVHPNTVHMELKGENGRELSITACSTGGGRILVTELQGIEVNFTGDLHTLIVSNMDDCGQIADVTAPLSRAGVNIAFMRLCRDRRGGRAIMVIEADQPIPGYIIDYIRMLRGILSVTYYEKAEG
ncbi:MAG: L-serine ammonia-lyase, iron-sulfur-dependent subunit beta [Candidatus Heteroscillospira sp.]|jgi:L-serine dehydratase